MKNICLRLLLKMCSWNWGKLKYIRSLNFTFKNRLFQHQYQKQVKMFVFTVWLVSHEVRIHISYYFSVVRNKLHKYIQIKRTSKVQEKNMSFQRALNFDQWKIFSENYKPMRVLLWLVYKFTENCQIYRLFLRVHSRSKKVSYISWHNRYPNLKTTCHIKLFFFVNLAPKELTPSKISHICRCAFKKELS